VTAGRDRSVLLAALLAVLLYAAFAAGAAREPGQAWFEAAIVVVALGAAAWALLGARVADVRLPPAAWWGVGLLAAFAAWSGLGILWSIAPDRTWDEFNRALAYALIAGLGLLAGATVPRATERFARGFLVLVVVVALYALGGKVIPGVHVGGLFDLNQTAEVARLRAPLEYWNALGLLCALAAPLAIRMAADPGRGRAGRLAALEAVFLLAVVAGLTYSRGAVGAFLIAALVLTLAGRGSRLRGLVVLALAVLAAAAPLAVAFQRPALKINGAPLNLRIHDGLILGGVLLLCAGVLLAVGVGLLRHEPRLNWSGARTRRVFRLAAAAAVLLVLVGAAGLARSQRGFSGSISHAVAGVTELRQDKVFDPVRLASTNSGNRWVWWKEAVGAWSDRPFAGWGAGSFALLHLRYRHDALPVTQAHSVPLQMLAETGVVGLVLSYGGLLALLAAAIARTRRLRGGRGRDLSIALLAAAVAWLAHAFYDWDWNIPAVTAPVLVMLGILAARPVPRPPSVLPLTLERPMGARAALVAIAALVAAAALGSAVLPLLAADKSDAAAAVAARGTPDGLEQAAAQADLAARLDPVSSQPLFVAAAIASARGRLLDARADLLEAAERTPDDPQVWSRLADLALQLADRQGFLKATERLYALDPHNPEAAQRGAQALLAFAPPAASATATGTPLVVGTPPPVPPAG